jgi:polyribonucleotide nucleotidyltransferase
MLQVAGTAQGITAVQLDTKLPGVDISLLNAALEPAAAARQQLLQAMAAAAAGYEAGLRPEQAPQHGGIEIMKELVPRLIGPQVGVLKNATAPTAGCAATSACVQLCLPLLLAAACSGWPEA